MKKIVFIAILILLAATTAYYCLRDREPAEKKIARILVAQVDSFAAVKEQFREAVEHNAPDAELQQLFRQTRLSYKKFEWAAEYFVPQVTRFVNGPPVPEVEPGGMQVFDPQGLQVIEAMIFPKLDRNKKTELINRIQLLQNGCDLYKSHFQNIDILDWQVFDAAKLQVFRVLTLGITGFDAPLVQSSLPESAVSLQSLQTAMGFYTTNGDEGLQNRLSAASAYLLAHQNFNTFNRAAFITDYGNPVTISISNLQKHDHIHMITYNRLLNQDAPTLFDPHAFNLNAYIPDPTYTLTAEKIALGKTLFADPILSLTGKRSCQTCHQPDRAFTDGMVKNTIFNTNKPLRRNTPTLINAALQPSQFYDIRSAMLEDQAADVIANTEEMHGSLSVAARRLSNHKAYRQLFAKAFPDKKNQPVDTAEIVNVLGSYVRSLTLLNSRFDDYMRGNKAAMNAQEINGFNLFMGKAKCGTCHYMPLFNGTFPPRFVKIETEVIGVPQNTEGKAIDADMGRYSLVKVAAFKHAFKTTTVRNAAQTAPYMHNGVFRSLDEVVDFYNKGGGAGLGYTVDNQTLPFDQLHLDKKECADIVAFIKALDSRVRN